MKAMRKKSRAIWRKHDISDAFWSTDDDNDVIFISEVRAVGTTETIETADVAHSAETEEMNVAVRKTDAHGIGSEIHIAGTSKSKTPCGKGPMSKKSSGRAGKKQSKGTRRGRHVPKRSTIAWPSALQR